MKATEQTIQQIERAIKKITEKFPASEETSLMTDIHIRVTQETGEFMAFDDEDNEITRCIVEQWIDNTDDNFYEAILPIIRKCIERKKNLVEAMGILTPFSFVLEDDDKEHLGEIYVVDDDTVIFDPELMKGLDKELDSFLDDLLK
jgi:hypothetical protein